MLEEIVRHRRTIYSMKNIAIITAAGLGKRMGEGRPKQYLELAGRPILCHTLDKFEAASLVDEIIVVSDAASLQFVREKMVSKYSYKKIKDIIKGGEKRQDSVCAGLAAAKGCDIVCVHDGVRPFVAPELINKGIEEARSHGACIVAIPVKDTIKRVDGEGRIAETVERAGLWRAQTPQTFRYDILKKAMDKAMKENFYGTDEAMLVERLGKDIFILAGDERNIKITTPEDLKIAETLCA